MKLRMLNLNWPKKILILLLWILLMIMVLVLNLIQIKLQSFLKTIKLSLKIIYFSLSISFILIIIKNFSRSNLNFYPFTINSIDLFLSFLGYGFLGAYQIAQPFAFALTDSINVFKIEFLSSAISLGLIYLIALNNKFSIHLALVSFCLYTFCNYLQANYRNSNILKEKNV